MQLIPIKSLGHVRAKSAFILFIFSFCFIGTLSFLHAQRNIGEAYRAQFKKYRKIDTDTSLVYFDSAYHAFIEQKHFASAAMVYLDAEDSLLSRISVDSAFRYARQVYDSARYLRKYRTSSFVNKVNMRVVDYYYNRNQFDSAASTMSSTLSKAMRKFGTMARENAHLYHIQAFLSYQRNEIDSAKYWMNLAAQTRREDKLIEDYIFQLEYHVLDDQEGTYSRSDDWEKDQLMVIDSLYESLAYLSSGDVVKFEQAFNDLSFRPDSSSALLLTLKYFYAHAALLFEKGEFNESLQLLKDHLAEGQASYHESHPIISSYYLLISKIYYEKSDFGASKEFTSRLLLNLDRVLVGQHPLKAEAYYEYSRALSALESYSPAFAQIDSAIRILEGGEQNDLLYAKCLGQKGKLFYHTYKLDSGEAYLLDALFHFGEIFDSEINAHFARTYNDLGELYQRNSADIKAIGYYRKGLAINRQLLGKVNPVLGHGYYNIGTLYHKNARYTEALDAYQVSMISNIYDFTSKEIRDNPGLDGVLSDFILLRSLTGKVESLESEYQDKKDTTHLHTALRTYDLIVKLIDQLRTSYVSEESKRFLSEKTSYLYERAIQLCLQLAELTGDNVYQEKAFTYSEKSRAGILLSGVKEANAKKLAGVPDSLLVFEKELVQRIGKKEIELFEELKKGNRARQATVSILQEELFGMKHSYDDFIAFLEEEYQNYYQLKYDDYCASVDDVKKLMLTKAVKNDKKKYHLLEYFIGKEDLYIFHITSDTYSLSVVEKPENFDSMIKGWRNRLVYNIESGFLDKSEVLYRLLVPEGLEAKSHYFIVPDGILSYVPFESLLTTRSDRKMNKQRFFMQENTISYTYSATLSVEMTKYEYEGSNFLSFAGFAPVFADTVRYRSWVDSESPDEDEVTEQEYVHTYQQLSASADELETIYKTLRKRKYATNAYFYNSASKENLYTESTLSSRFLHFASHGILDEEHPDFSGVVMADSSKTAILTLGEIYGFETKSEVVSLSACQTGLGELLRGEGLVSFSRGFFYSGTDFIIVSLWKVEDQSTNELMTQFYKRYAKKKKKDIYKCFNKARKTVARKTKERYLSNMFPFVIIGMHSEG